MSEAERSNRAGFDKALGDADTGAFAKRRSATGAEPALRPAVSEQERLLRESRIDLTCWALHAECRAGDHTYTEHRGLAVRVVDILFPTRVI